MKKTTPKLYELLLFTPEQYDDNYFEVYFRWCMNFMQNEDLDLQKILANTKISKWFNYEFEQLEYLAYEAILPVHGQIKYTQARTMYAALTAPIFMKFPSALIDEARKINVYAN